MTAARQVTPQLSEYFMYLVIKMHETCSWAQVSHCTAEFMLKTRFKLYNNSSASCAEQSPITMANSSIPPLPPGERECNTDNWLMQGWSTAAQRGWNGPEHQQPGPCTGNEPEQGSIRIATASRVPRTAAGTQGRAQMRSVFPLKIILLIEKTIKS